MILPRKGLLIAARYELVRPLASGGMGSVWIAHHRELEVDVTVKFMAPSLVASANARIRFEREAKVAARLDSQHVVQVVDYGVEGGAPFLVMELLKGESLGTRLARAGRLSLPAVAPLVPQICRALRTAHEAGLVHRDLKPGNIFLALKDGDEVAKVLDFGIVKAGFGVSNADTEVGMILGSVHYMSPEQIRDPKSVDHRSDLWSIGVVLYRALTGRLPFQGKELGDVIARICTDSIAAPSSIAPDLPAPVDEIFTRLLARPPDERFQSARELSDAFGAVAAEAEPVLLHQKWKKTLPLASLRPSPSRVTSEPLKLETTTRPRPAPAGPSPHGAPAREPTAADEPTIALSAVMVVTEADPVADPPPPASAPVPPARPARHYPPPRWPVWAATVAAVASLLAAIALRSASPGGAPVPVPSVNAPSTGAVAGADQAVSVAPDPTPSSVPVSTPPTGTLATEAPSTPRKAAPPAPPTPAPPTSEVRRDTAPPSTTTAAPPAPAASLTATPPPTAPKPPPPHADKLKDIMP